MATTPKIVKPKDTIQDALKMVVYGNSGVGKTTFAATAPKALILSAEAGLLSIADKDVDVISINSWKDLQEAFEYLKNGKHEYQTVVLDSLTELQKKHQDYLLQSSGHERLSMQSWGDNIQAMRKTCRAFRDLPMNVILISLVSSESGEDGSGGGKSLALNGKSLPNEVMGFMDLVGYMVAAESKDDGGEVKTKRAIRFQPTETIMAKDRSGKLNDWELPDFAAIYNKVFGKNGSKTTGGK